MNVTSQLIMKPEEAEGLFRHPILEPVLDIAREWFKDEERVTFHDPLAAVSLFHDDVCLFEQGGLIHRNRQLFAFRIHLLEEKERWAS